MESAPWCNGVSASVRICASPRPALRRICVPSANRAAWRRNAGRNGFAAVFPSSVSTLVSFGERTRRNVVRVSSADFGSTCCANALM